MLDICVEALYEKTERSHKNLNCVSHFSGWDINLFLREELVLQNCDQQHFLIFPGMCLKEHLSFF
jgi:hypothetical protein